MLDPKIEDNNLYSETNEEEEFEEYFNEQEEEEFINELEEYNEDSIAPECFEDNSMENDDVDVQVRSFVDENGDIVITANGDEDPYVIKDFELDIEDFKEYINFNDE